MVGITKWEATAVGDIMKQHYCFLDLCFINLVLHSTDLCLKLPRLESLELNSQNSCQAWTFIKLVGNFGS